MALNVNALSIIEAAKYYASIGVITHPLQNVEAKVKSPGKQPILNEWQKIQTPFSEEEIERKFSNNGNLGFICGARSNLTVLDVDWYVKGIWDNILLGVDTKEWIKQFHTHGKYHYIFMYFNDIKAKTYQGLGFDILSDTEKIDAKNGVKYIGGNNCVATPSIHTDGNKYQITGNIEERPTVPIIVTQRINDLIKTYKEITDKILPKCRRTFQGLFDAIFINKKHELYHKTSIFMGDKENRDRHLHLCAEMKANGATDHHLNLVCILIFGDRYDSVMTERELQHVEAYTAKNETLRKDPYLRTFFNENDKQPEKQPDAGKGVKEIKVHFDEVAKEILKDYYIFTMRDNKQMYLYTNGVYKNEGSEAILDTKIRDIHDLLYLSKWMELNAAFGIPEHIPKATTRYVSEVFAYIRAYTHITRDTIEEHEVKYINVKNGLFNLETWKIEEHNPEIITISQIPVNYDPNAGCPQINKFLRDVAKPEDIDFLEEWFGYCLTIDVSYQKALMLYGIPGTGKSVLDHYLKRLLGKKTQQQKAYKN